MKKYIGLKCEIVFFDKQDVITQSSITGNTYFDNELPIVPIGGAN